MKHIIKQIRRNGFGMIAGGAATILTLTTNGAMAHEVKVPSPKLESRPLVQIAILLDTSSSMSGLIDQAKGQLWKVVNEVSCARPGERTPVVEVALYEYGKSLLAKSAGWIRKIQPLTTDLDTISEELFGLETTGGKEYCGWVIRNAVRELQWNPSSQVYKAIFIAGNEPFTQGPVDYREACRMAIENGIVVNTIHCGSRGAALKGAWEEGALMAEGQFMTIDHNRAVAHRRCPQDDEIIRLGQELNATYLPYGERGAEGRRKQLTQDTNSLSLAAEGSVVHRSLFKATHSYNNDHWDLVDACRSGKVALKDIAENALPAELRSLDDGERSAYLERKAQERKILQARMEKLREERNQFLRQEFNEKSDEVTLDGAMIQAIRAQMKNRGNVRQQ